MNQKIGTKKAVILGLILAAICVVVVLAIILIGGKALFRGQYNDKGVSIRPNITIDNNAQESYLGESAGYDIYTVHLRDTYLINKEAEEIDLKDAIKAGDITIDDMLRACKKDSTGKVYFGENYKLMLSDDKCVIAPLDYND